jgi:hypothetical protein
MWAMGGRGRLLRRGALPVCAALLLAGCASMPSSGEVRKVGDGQRADADSQVRVFGIAPRAGAKPSEIVSGFLEATTSGEADFATAKKYLSKGLSGKWNPLAGVTVFSSSDIEPSGSGDEKSTTVSLSGTKAAVVDAKDAYTPDQSGFQTSFHLIKQNNEWRIDGLRDGLVLSEPDFQRLYHSANMYYFARLGADEDRDGTRRQTLVADPVYLRNQTDPLVSTVSALLAGPSDWLAPVTTSAAPAGTELDDKAPDQGVSLDDSQRLRVRLDHSADHLPHQSCVLLAAQLFATVQAQASAELSAAEVLRTDGSKVCEVSDDDAYSPEILAGASSRQYYIGAADHNLLELTADSSTAMQVAGPFGDKKAGLGSVAVRRDEQEAAGVLANGRDLVVGPLTSEEPFGQPVLASGAQNPKKDGLSAPSWDGFDDLWVADRNPKAPKLFMLRDGGGAPHEVAVPDLNGRVESLRVSADGVRIALIVRGKDGATTLQLGRVQRGTAQDPDDFSVTLLRNITPVGENVTSVSWAGDSRLVVLGSEIGGGVQQIQYMNTDGSAAPALEGINEATSVAASEDQSKPLLASYNGSVYRLPPDANWKQVSPPGINPVYPG